jgi:cytochrome d ubiquinol oxidase subunit II
MATLWFILVAGMLTLYALLDGFDLGAGAIHLVAAKKDAERRMIIGAIGPVWDGNEVWLIAAGGTLVFTFPMLYASAFSGFYLSLIIVLWLLMIRGLAIELRSHVDNPVWVSLCDGLFFLGSSLLALFFGVAIGNVVRGVPLGANGYFFEPLWTSFSPKDSEPGILDWYTVLIGILTLFTLVIHGSIYIAYKTDGEVNLRAREIGRKTWFVVAGLTLVSTIATFWLRSEMLDRFEDHPWGFVFPAIAIVALLATGYFAYEPQDGRRFVASSAFILGMLSSTAFALYPNLLPATNSAYSLTVSNSAAPEYGLKVGLIWWSIGILLAIAYFATVYRLFRGKVRVDSVQY